MLIIASATRKPDEAAFMADTPLGKSLQKLGRLVEFKLSLACARTDGLSKFYNEVLDAAGDDVVLFVHDDFAINDLYFAEKLTEAFKEYHIVGLAGCRTPPTCLPIRWHHPDHEPSGTIANAPKGTLMGEQMISFGPTPARAVVLDGVFMAVHAPTLKKQKVRFDERFLYHQYDLDMTYTASRAGLIVGTWPIWGCHFSTEGAGYNSREWREAAEAYRDKWARILNAPPEKPKKGKSK